MPSARDLRASLFGRTPPPQAPRFQHAQRTPTLPGFNPAAVPEVPPSAAELLSTTPALVRLCESYHRAHAEMTSRGRRQRMGIFVFVGAISIAALMLHNSGTFTAALVSDLVLAAAGASMASVGLLALLWLRDERRLRGVQGERMLRALQSSCTLPSERVSAYRRTHDPVSAFFECYASWRSAHASRLGSSLLKGARQTRA